MEREASSFATRDQLIANQTTINWLMTIDGRLLIQTGHNDHEQSTDGFSQPILLHVVTVDQS